MKETIEYIDLTPTWTGLYPVIERIVLCGTRKGREGILGEIKRLCEFADKVNAKDKAEKEAAEAQGQARQDAIQLAQETT